MAIWLDENSRILVQGMTGSEGTKHTRRMLASGTTIVGGVNARKAERHAAADVRTVVRRRRVDRVEDLNRLPVDVHEALGDLRVV